jgi:DNA-binding NarL/FixJ family response regulator
MLTACEPASIRILHCDDHESVRALLAGMVRAHPSLDMLAPAASHAEVVTKAARLRPDLVILDLDAGRDEHVVEKLRAGSDARILVLSGEPNLSDDPLVAQADGFVSKTAGTQAIMRAIQSAALEASHTVASAA